MRIRAEIHEALLGRRRHRAGLTTVEKEAGRGNLGAQLDTHLYLTDHDAGRKGENPHAFRDRTRRQQRRDQKERAKAAELLLNHGQIKPL